MPAYSVFERNIARLLEKYPHAKVTIKKAYQYFCYVIHKPKCKYTVNKDCELICLHENAFWGYYDKSPVYDKHFLCHSFNDFPNVRNCNELEILCDNFVVSHTSTWNWQQGAMTTWLNNYEFIHNYFDFENKVYKSKIINIKNNSSRTIDFPIYAISKDASFALTLNFSRLAKLRPDYGYFNKECSNIPKYDENDGIYYVDLNRNTQKLIISFKTLFEFHHRTEMENAWHKVNHIEISPDNKRFIFHHRWFDDEGRKWSRLISADIDGSDLFLLSDDVMVSHCCWRNNNEIAGWMRKKEGDHYYLLQDKSSDYSIIGQDSLKEDGHPSFSADGRFMLTDTYPDKARIQKLYLYDMLSSKNVELGVFFSSLKYYGEERCDLHPRFNIDNNFITFDSVFNGKRCLYELNISKLLK